MVDVTALLALPVENRPQAEAFLTALHGLGLDYHFDDGAVDCLAGNGHVTVEEAEGIERKVSSCYDAWIDAGADMYHDCPIGFVLELQGH